MMIDRQTEPIQLFSGSNIPEYYCPHAISMFTMNAACQSALKTTAALMAMKITSGR